MTACCTKRPRKLSQLSTCFSGATPGSGALTGQVCSMPASSHTHISFLATILATAGSKHDCEMRCSSGKAWSRIGEGYWTHISLVLQSNAVNDSSTQMYHQNVLYHAISTSCAFVFKAPTPFPSKRAENHVPSSTLR